MTQEEQHQEKREQTLASLKKVFSGKKETKNEEKSESKEAADNSHENHTKKQSEQEAFLAAVEKRKHWIQYILLGIIIYIGTFIRTRNLNFLKDATTGDYIPLALDPHLFFKYAKEIVETGSLAAQDMTRFVPEGIATAKYLFVSSFIASFYKVLHFFNPEVTIGYADIIYPVVCFAIALIFFYLLVRELFDVKVALLATLFLSVIPAFLQRTMAGFADHEALGVMLMFMALFCFVKGWKEKETKKGNQKSLAWSLAAGTFTGLMGLGWGGWKFLILMISLFTLAEFFFNKIKERDIYNYFAWFLPIIPITVLWIPKYSLSALIGSLTTGIAFLVAFILLVDLTVFRKDYLKIKKRITTNSLTKKLPANLTSLSMSLVLGLVFALALLGPANIVQQISEVEDTLLHPLGNDRWELTVAEQHQPYFTDWIGQFGPQFMASGSFNGVPTYLLFFMFGSVLLFYVMVQENKQKWKLTAAYAAFIFLFTMSRYSASSATWNGTSTLSKTAYLGSLALFAGYITYTYLSAYYKDQQNLEQIMSWDKKYVFVLIWFVIMVVAARGANRLFFIFAPISAVVASYFTVWLTQTSLKIKNQSYRYIAIGAIALLLLSPLASPFQGVIPHFHETSLNQASFTGPGYSAQWQNTGAWARENLPENAVFGHWWDYGYWVQNGFGAATILDGANSIKYWNYLMGRHVLTGQTQEEALEFLKVHQGTHFLIVSDEIPKYGAYSSIGSDQNYDRYSWITSFHMDPGQTTETRDGTLLTFTGSYALDDDFTWEGKVFPRQQAGIGGILLPITTFGEGEQANIAFGQPTAALFYNGQRVDVPLECVYYQGEMMWFEEEGLGGCLRIMPVLNGDGSLNNPLGSGLYVSEEGVNALWTNLYIFEQNNPRYDTSAFISVYNDDQTPLAIYQGRIIGPHKIWEINYPEGFTVDAETEALYLGGNELLPDFFFDVN